MKRSIAVMVVLCLLCAVSATAGVLQSDPPAVSRENIYLEPNSGPYAVDIANSGTATLNISAISLRGTDHGDFTLSKGSCSSLTPSIAPGGSCSVIIDVKRPVTSSGDRSALLNVSLNDGQTFDVSQITGSLSPTTGDSITGFVKDSASREGLGLIAITLHDSNNSYVHSTYSNDTGGYAFNDLTTGKSYKVEYWSHDHLSQWFNNKASFETAEAVVVPSTMLADVLMTVNGGISGRVTDDSAVELPDVSVQLFDADNRLVGGTQTSAYGYYYFSDLPSGEYRILFDGTSTGYVRKYNGNVPDIGSAGTVQVDAPEFAWDVNAVLAKGGSIAGRVTNKADAAISGVLVRVFDEYDNFMSQANTDNNGNYAAKGLPAGKHKVRFEGYGKGYVNQYYGSTLYGARAVLVDVAGTNQTGGIDGSLASGGSISGKVTKADGITGIGGVVVEVYDDNSGWISGTSTNSDGTYTAPGVPAGTFKIAFMAGSGYASQWYGGKGSFAAATPVTLASVTNKTGINATLVSGKSIFFNGGRRGFGDTALNSTTAYRTITIRNQGTASLSIGQIAKSGTNAADFSFKNDRCSNSTIAAGAGCTFQLFFKPTTTGDKTADVTIPSDDPDTPSLGINFRGTGFTTAGSISITPSTLDFGSIAVGSTAPAKTFTFKNDGPGSVTVSDAYMTGNEDQFPDTYAGDCPDLPHKFLAGETCTAGYAFEPTSAGAKAAALVIKSNASNLPTATINLTGTGLISNYTLTTNITGSGTINGSYSCGSATCSGSFPVGTSLTLQATPSNGLGYYFYGWSGACSGNGSCTISLNGNTTVNAIFKIYPFVRVSGNDYDTLQKGFNAVVANDTVIKATARTFMEDLLFDKDYAVLLNGGFSAVTDSSPTGETMVKGSLTIKKGGITTDRLSIF